LVVEVKGSDEPLNDVRGLPPFDVNACDDALLLLPLLRWGPLLNPKGSSSNSRKKGKSGAGGGEATVESSSSSGSGNAQDDQGAGAAAAAAATPQRFSKSAAATAAAGAAAAAAVSDLAENGGGPAVLASHGGTAKDGCLSQAVPQGPLFEVGFLPSFTDELDFGKGHDDLAAQARKDAAASELARRDLLPRLPPHGAKVGGGGLKRGAALTALLAGSSSSSSSGGGGCGSKGSRGKGGSKSGSSASSSSSGGGDSGSSSSGGGGGVVGGESDAVEAWPLGVSDNGDLWDDAVEWGPDNMSLSMLASGIGWALDRVPGASTIPAFPRSATERTGLWFKYKPVLGVGALPVPEVTRVVGNHFRQLNGPNGPTGPHWYPGGAAARLAKAERMRDGKFAASTTAGQQQKKRLGNGGGGSSSLSLGGNDGGAATAHSKNSSKNSSALSPSSSSSSSTGSSLMSSSSSAASASVSRVMDKEATEAILDITGRGPANTVVVNLAQALDTPLLTPPLVAWVHQCLNAPSPGEEEPERHLSTEHSWVAFQINSARATRMGPVESALDARVSQPCVALTASEHVLDFAIDPKGVSDDVEPQEEEDQDDQDDNHQAGGGGGGGGEGANKNKKGSLSADSSSSKGGGSSSSSGSGGTITSKVGHRRRWHWRHGPTGFRHLLHVPLLFPDSHVASRFFGLTLRGALPNQPLCGTGHRWCSAEGCRKALTRLRSADEYSKLAQAQGHQGAADPGIFTCHLRGVCDQLSMDEVTDQYTAMIMMMIGLGTFVLKNTSSFSHLKKNLWL
jgi:hypothetical protein